jgi:hypothetical protein
MKQTTLEKLISQLDKEIKRNTLGGIQYYGLLQAKELAINLLTENRLEIEQAFDSAKNYPDADGDKYYFMNYISND